MASQILFPSDQTPKLLHFCNRLSLGPRPGDLALIRQIGLGRYVQQQLNPTSSTTPTDLVQRLKQLDSFGMRPGEIAQRYGSFGQRLRTEADREEARKRSQTPGQQAMVARLLRAIASPNQLHEVMVDFWFNHFNVFLNGFTRLWIGSYEEHAIRPHALGRFRDLLGATAHHPAMLVYLDNWLNTAPNSSGTRGRFQGLNENYARELLELHTLGVDGGYTQQDVIALARIFTGWGLPRLRAGQFTPDGFYFDVERHDFGEKVFLGRSFKGEGQSEGEQVLDLLAQHPATARHISYKLAQYFVADDPPVDLVRQLAQTFQRSGGNISELLSQLFQSTAFNDPQGYGTKFKTPYQFLLSALRAIGTRFANPQPVFNALSTLDMPLYRCRTPNGYGNTQADWLNPDALQKRLNLATVISQGRMGSGTSRDVTPLMATLGDLFSSQTREVVLNSPKQLQTALILGSPEFMYR